MALPYIRLTISHPYKRAYNIGTPVMPPDLIYRAVLALWYEAIAVSAAACVEPDTVHPGKVALEIAKEFGYDSVQDFITVHNRINDDA